MNTTIEYLDIITSALTASTNVKVISGNKWCANVKDHTLQYDAKDLMSLPFYVSKGLLIHEIGHINYTVQENTTTLEKKYPSAMHEIYNCLEDKRIEYKSKYQLGDYARDALDNLNSYFIQHNLITHTNDYKQLPNLVQFLHIYDIVCECQVNNNLSSVIGYSGSSLFHKNYTKTDYTMVFDEEVKKRFIDNRKALLNIMDITNRSGDLKTLKYYIDRDLYPIIKDYIEEFKDQGQGQGQGKSNISSFKDSKAEKSGKIEKDFQTIQLTESFNPVQSIKPQEIEAKMILNSYTQTLSHKLRDILEYRKTIKYTGNFNKGKLINKNIYKVALNEKRIFSRKYNPDLPDKYNFHIALDASGSMSGDNKVYNAVLASYLIKFVNDNLHLKAYFYAFSDLSNTYKLESPNNYEVLNGGTADLKALQLIKETVQQIEGDNIIFIITDGQISAPPERQKVIYDLEKMHCTIIGIGIGQGVSEQDLKTHFKNSIYVPDINKLPLELANILRNLIKN